MSITRRLTPILLLLLILATGCRSHKQVPQKPNTANDTAITTNQGQVTPATPVTPPKPIYTPHYYSANFNCNAMGYKANGQMRIQSDSVIWACATKVVELGRAKLTPDSVTIYVKLMNRCFQGTYNDFYKRFHYRTNFKEVYQMVTADDAEQQISALAKRLGADITLSLDPLKEVDKLNFPMAIPNKVNPL